MENNAAQRLNVTHPLTMTNSLYDQHPPPHYPYSKSASAYSAVIQLYARSRQLPTAWTLFLRNRTESPDCRLGCWSEEDAHHLFVNCPQYSEWREKEKIQIKEKSFKMAVDMGLQQELAQKIAHTATQLFSDNNIWPIHRTRYYLGHIPSLDNIIPIHECNTDLDIQTTRKIRRKIATEW